MLVRNEVIQRGECLLPAEALGPQSDVEPFELLSSGVRDVRIGSNTGVFKALIRGLYIDVRHSGGERTLSARLVEGSRSFSTRLT